MLTENILALLEITVKQTKIGYFYDIVSIYNYRSQNNHNL